MIKLNQFKLFSNPYLGRLFKISNRNLSKSNLLLYGLLLLGFIFSGLTISSLLTNQALADSTTCQTTNIRTDGLISAQLLVGSTKFGNSTGNCVLNNKSFIDINSSNYASLKELYFTRATGNNKITVGTGNVATITAAAPPANALINVTGDLDVNSNITPTSNSVWVIFVEGDLGINSNITFANNAGGIVFVVNGTTRINRTVTIINAVIIGNNKIYTAWDSGGVGNSPDSTNITAAQLNIYGSLISLSATNGLVLKRSLADNTSQPAEKITYQPKYLVILKGLMTQTLTVQKEVN